MTDDQSVEAHDHEETLSAAEVVHEPPSDYEFADEHGSAAADEHTEEHTPLPSDTKPSQRSPLLPIMAAIGGVLVLGAAAWWQFGGGSSSSQSMPMSSASNAYMPAPAPVIPGEAKAVVPTPSPGLPVAPTTGTSNSDGSTTDATSAQPASAVMPSPTPMAVADAMPKPADTSAMPAALAPMPAPAMPAPLAPAVVAVAMPSPAMPSAAIPVVMPSVVAPVATPASMTGDANHRIDALAARIDTLQKALDQANMQLGQMTNMVASTAGTSSSKDMQGRLDAMEQELAQMKHSSGAPSLAAPAIMPPEAMMGAEPSVIPSVAPASTHMSKHKTSHTHKAMMTHKTKKKAPVVMEASARMVLRAAVPGEAWVATSATSSDLRQVEVGDTVPGIGKVTAIQQQGDSWVVQGTKGSLK